MRLVDSIKDKCAYHFIISYYFFWSPYYGCKQSKTNMEGGSRFDL